MPGGRLTQQDRQHIAAGLADGLGYAEIGRRLDRPASTVMREVTRNGGPGGYRATRAQEATRYRARRRKPAQPPAADNGQGRDPRQVREFTESFTELLIRQGMPRVTALVLVCLYTTDTGALTAAELVRRLRISPASVSHAVNYLEEQGMLGRQRTPGVRRESYLLDDEIWISSLLATVRMNEALADASRRGAEIFHATTPAGARFESSAELLNLVNEALTNVINQWRRPRRPPSP